MTKVFAANYIGFLMLGSAFVGVMAVRHGDFLVTPTLTDLFWTLIAAPILFAAVMGGIWLGTRKR